MVAYTAVMLATLLIAVQVAVWGLAQLSCRYAANHALQVTRVQGGTAAAGETDAAAVLDAINANLVSNETIHADRDATTATVAVKAHALQVLPILTVPVGATVSAPVETLNPPPQGG
jgi:hypothetical protein